MTSTHRPTEVCADLSYEETKRGSFSLRGELTLGSVGKVQELLLAALQTASELQIDLLNISRIDTAGVQLLLALELEGQRRQRPVVWLGFSLVVEDAVELLNIAPHISRPYAVVWS